MADATTLIDIQTIGAYCGAFIAMGGVAAGITSFITKDVKRDAKDNAKDAAQLRHDLKSQIMRIDGLDRERNKDAERIVKLELRQENIEKGQARIEAQANSNHKETIDAMKAWADQFSESIRELRDARLKT